MNKIQLPYYLQLTIKLILVLLICLLIYVSQTILVPIAFSILLAIVLLPFVNFLRKKHFPAVAANLIAIFIALIFIISILYFLSSQISGFLRDIPSIKKHISEHYAALQMWIENKLHISIERQTAFISNAASHVKDSGTTYIGQTFLTITQMVLFMILIMVYTFFILYYRHTIRRFFFDIFSKNHEAKVTEILLESKSIIQKYIRGLLIEMLIVATANSTILLIIGIKYAIFFGVFSAILNLVPHIGMLISIGFTALVTLTTDAHLGSVIWLMIGMEAVNFSDANFIMPKIVGSRVKINALITILGVLIGATLIGIPGIFLALPTIAVLKIIFDRVEGLEAWGALMGDETATPAENSLIKKAANLGRKVSLTKKPRYKK